MTLLLALLLAPAAQAGCLFTAVETQLSLDPAEPALAFVEQSRLRLVADEDGCSTVTLPVPGLQALSLRSLPPEGRPETLSPRRFSVHDGEATLFVPELNRGGAVEVSLERRVRGPWTWALPAYPIEQATLQRPAGLPALAGRGGTVIDASAEKLRATDLSAGSTLIVQIGAAEPPGPPLGGAPLLPTGRELVYEADPPARGGEPATGRTRVTELGRIGPSPGPTGWVGLSLPPAATEAWCALGEGPRQAASDGRCLGNPPPETAVRWGYTLPHLLVVGQGVMRGAAPWKVEGGRLAYAAPMREGADGVIGSDSMAHFRLLEVGGQPVFPDKEAALAALDRAWRMASIPEPAVPLSLKNWRGDDPAELVAAMLDQLGREVTVTPSPFAPSLQPRPLLDARRSGWASPIEAALIFARYLQQEKLDATVIPAATTEGPHPEFPDGYDRAVVRWRRGAQTVWIDPACTTCALGELPLELWSAPAFADGLERLPPPPEAPTLVWTGRYDAAGAFSAAVRMSAPLAQHLRARLGAAPKEAAPDLLRALTGFVGGRVEAVEGTASRGAPAELRVSGGALSPLDVALQAYPARRLPLVLERRLSSEAPRWQPGEETRRCPGFVYTLTRTPTSWAETLTQAPQAPDVAPCALPTP